MVADVTKREDTSLNGLKEIAAYVKKSEKVTRKLINEESLPARKIGGEWLSDKEAINNWRRSLLKNSAAFPRA